MICDYCSKTFPEKEIAVVTWNTNQQKNKYCPKCLPEVRENVRSVPWVIKDGYTIQYPK